jgi:hypothetical protein
MNTQNGIGEGSGAMPCSTAARTFTCTIYLKDKTIVTTETTDPNGFQKSLSHFMDEFYRRGWFRKVNSVVKLCGIPEAFIPIEHINFYTIQEKSQ